MKKYKYHIMTILVLFVFCITICFIPIGISRFIPIVEKQINEEYGIKVNINKLILRLGPSLKIKAPIMHIMLEDDTKIAQFDNVRFVIPWSSFFKKEIRIKRMYANKLIIKADSDNELLKNLPQIFDTNKTDEIPNILLKNYSLTYFDKKSNRKYRLSGTDFDLNKIKNFKNFKIKTLGEFFINERKFISYDLTLNPQMQISKNLPQIDILELFEQIEILDFHSDIIADLKFYNSGDSHTLISGLVNIDNISVLDPAKKCPKSFIYLTFLGDKVGVLSNIYPTNDKKVIIDGIINNSNKPGIDLKVKADKIQISDLYKKIKLIINYSKLKSIKAIDGTLSADFNIKGDITKLKSNGYLKISDASLKSENLNINKIETDIDFSGNIISIQNAIGYINNAPIMLKGKIDKNIDLEILMNKVELKHLLPSKFGITSGVGSIVAYINGTVDRPQHKENIQIDNFRLEQNKNIISFSNLKYDTNKDNNALISNISIGTNTFENIKLPLLRLNIDQDSIKIPNTNIYMPNSKFTLKGGFTNYTQKDLSFNINLDGMLNSRDIRPLNNYSSTYPTKISINGNKQTQNINSQLVLENASFLNEPVILNLTSILSNKNLKLEDLSFYSFQGNFQDDLKNNIKGIKKITLNGTIDNITDPILKNVRLYIPQLVNITAYDNIMQLKGDVFINGKPTAPDIVGQISVQNAINQFLQLSLNNLIIDFNKDTAIINAPQIKFQDSVISVSSSLLTNFSKGVILKNLNIKSKYINTDTFLMYKDTPIFGMIPVTIQDGKLYSERTSSTIYGSPLVFTALTGDIILKDSILTLKNITSEFYNGKFAGNIIFNLKDEHFDTSFQARKVSASPIFNVISNRKETISGTMDVDASLCGNIATKDSLNGNMKFEINNGRMSTLGKIEHLLYAQNVIADNMLRTSLSIVTKALTLKDTGLFKYLRGDISLNNGIANIKMLQTQGPLMSLFIKGIYNPTTDYANLTVLGRISDEIISGLGAFGDFSFNKLLIMLTGEEPNESIRPEDFEKIPPLTMRNTKEFRSIIDGNIDKTSSVKQFNWISFTQKAYRQTEYSDSKIPVPEFIDSLPY